MSLQPGSCLVHGSPTPVSWKCHGNVTEMSRRCPGKLDTSGLTGEPKCLQRAQTWPKMFHEMIPWTSPRNIGYATLRYATLRYASHINMRSNYLFFVYCIQWYIMHFFIVARIQTKRTPAPDFHGIMWTFPAHPVVGNTDPPPEFHCSSHFQITCWYHGYGGRARGRKKPRAPSHQPTLAHPRGQLLNLCRSPA